MFFSSSSFSFLSGEDRMKRTSIINYCYMSSLSLPFPRSTINRERTLLGSL